MPTTGPTASPPDHVPENSALKGPAAEAPSLQ
eukprot:CAMPEP_0198213556 /NCGR_PEP_ID=MMETSP1445-20131203/28936_1 /TAXON_ID=36898 /ORGANISM="Pyramimonas sp., Strain CCMP2087" /LENGTH=31 /DNA_ID= /DNA_START= /DNA_END= /DNA_ORIENTATION=